MFEVLVYVYEHFWRGDSCPELPQLGRKLSAAGFESDDIEQALDWLAGLSLAADAFQRSLVTIRRADPASYFGDDDSAGYRHIDVRNRIAARANLRRMLSA